METQINERIFETFPELESERLLFRAYKKDAEWSRGGASVGVGSSMY